MYREHIMDHFKHPRHFGELEHPTVSRHEKNPSCGDEVTVQLTIEDNKITNAAFSGDGCALSIAGTSMLLEEIIGKDVNEILTLPRDEMLEHFGSELTTMRVKCGLLGLHTVKKALATHLGKSAGEW